MRDVLDDILLQHAEEAAFLWMQRWRLVTAPHVSLSFLEGHDERLSAHLDGLELGGEAGWKFCESELEGGSAGAVFAATTLSLKARHEHRLDRLIAFVGAVPEVRRGLVASFGWVSPDYLQHTVKTLLSSTDSLRRLIGISACALHRVDPRVTTELDSACSARALRAA